MTNKGSRRSAAQQPIAAPESTSQATPELAPEPIEAVETEVTIKGISVLPKVEEVVKEAIATQQWLMQFTLNELYAVGITLPNNNMDSHIVLFNRNNGGQMPLADMQVAPNMTETDILRSAKRLVGAILNNLARSTSLI